jgi:hypothetical protein
MAASAVDSRSANQHTYGCLRGDFDTAYKTMVESSREFNLVLMTIPIGLSPEAHQERKNRAAQAYHDAHEQFLTAFAKLNEFMIGQIISSRAALHPAALQR